MEKEVENRQRLPEEEEEEQEQEEEEEEEEKLVAEVTNYGLTLVLMENTFHLPNYDS